MGTEDDATDVTPPQAESTRVLGKSTPRAIELTAELPSHTPSASGRVRRESAQALDFSANAHIGRFELIREIARGGMGQVFLGRDTKLGRKVAVKFLLRDDPQFVQRFVIEARATARCEHENIVTIFEVGEHERLPYMVLELLEGKTLADVLAGKPSVRQFVELMVPVARALERAHEQGIVHRDLKPSNIFVTARGQVKVLDFGVARLLDVEEEQALVGTMPYMSPEQWGAAEVGALSDLWAFGIMFWRAFTGVHPAGTTTPEKLRERLLDLDTPLPSIATRAPTLPADLVAIVDRCLAKRTRDRYPSATALLADLQAFLLPKAERSGGEVFPYRGLAAFGEDDAKFFFGRDNEIRTAIAQLDVWPLLAVIGPSGVGKSSFVHAGLVPAMRASAGNTHVHVLRPGRLPLHRLAALFDDVDIMPQLVESPGVFGVMLRQAAARKHQQILVVVDQLEELFTLCDSDDTRRLFLAALLAAADDATAPVRVVLSMRADFLDRLAGHKHFLSELTRGLFFLTSPDRDNLRETLVRPAERAGYAFEDPAIVDDMLDRLDTRHGALPLLSFAATRLWDARDRERKLLTAAAYNDMGGVGGAFARHADHVASAVPPQSQILLRAIMTRLVTPEGTRAVLDHSELMSLSPDRGEVERILDQLVHARLVQIHIDPTQGTTVEIVHEMLITEWPTLRRWLEDNHALRGFMAELRQAAKQWASRGKPADLVWRGATAREALDHMKRQLLDLSAIERDFIAAVQAQAARARRRRVLVWTSIVTTLGLVFAGGSFALVRIKLAEQHAKERAAEAMKAADEAKAARTQAEHDRAAAETASNELKVQYEKLAETQQQRAAAEQQAASAKAGEEMSKEQLAAANQALVKKVAEAQAAQAKAQANEVVAKQATEQVKKLLDAQKAENERLRREKSKIIDQKL